MIDGAASKEIPNTRPNVTNSFVPTFNESNNNQVAITVYTSMLNKSILKNTLNIKDAEAAEVAEPSWLNINKIPSELIWTKNMNVQTVVSSASHLAITIFVREIGFEIIVKKVPSSISKRIGIVAFVPVKIGKSTANVNV